MKTKNKMKIDHSEYWGTYEGKEIYRYYGPSAKAFSEMTYRDIVFAKDGILWMNGYKIGNVTENGHVTNWEPEAANAWKLVKEKKKSFKEVKGEPVVNTSKLVDEVLERAMNRTIEDLLGVKEKA
jgi:hypothetical protein